MDLNVNLLELIHLDYAMVVILITYILIKKVNIIKTKTSQTRTLTNVAASVVVGVIFYFLDSEEYRVQSLLLSACVAVTFYEWLLKLVFRKLDIEYEVAKDVKEKVKKEIIEEGEI